MKKILLSLFLFGLMLNLQSCEYVMLSAKERQVKGNWKQSFLFGKAIQSLNSDKSMDLYFGVKFGVEAIAHFKGSWEVVEDRLIIEINGEPDIQFKGNNYVEEFLNEHKDKLESAISSGKIITVDDSKLMLEEDGRDVVWKRASADEVNDLKSRFQEMANEK